MRLESIDYGARPWATVHAELARCVNRLSRPRLTDLQQSVNALTVCGRFRSQHNSFIEWWISARIRGRSYETEIATEQCVEHAAGSEAGGADFRGAGIRGM
jgi:hypothetical protein